jgi:tRNA threonylcarbamoyladenosine biosynthesis protein TsaE
MIIYSLDQLNSISSKIIKKISKEDTILLFGEIGVGKTTLVRSIINNLQTLNNEKETEVLSPTFNILYEYEIGKNRLMHYDLYRLKTSKEVDQLGIFSQEFKNIKLIEWAEIIETKPKDRLEIYLNYEKKNNSRNIVFKGHGYWKDFDAD